MAHEVKLRIRVYENVDISSYDAMTKVAEIIKMLTHRYNLKGVFMLYGKLNATKTKDVIYILKDNDKLFYQALEDSGKTVFKRDEILRLIDELESKFTYKTSGGSKKLELDRSELFWWLDENEGNFTLPKVHYQNGVAFIKRGKKKETIKSLSKLHLDLSAKTLKDKYTGLKLLQIKKLDTSMQKFPEFRHLGNQRFNSRVEEEPSLRAKFSYTDHTKWNTNDVGA